MALLFMLTLADLLVCSGMVALCAAPEVGTCVDAGDIFVRLCVPHVCHSVLEGKDAMILVIALLLISLCISLVFHSPFLL